MKKTFTKSLALLLAVLMLMTAMPMGVFAAGSCAHKWSSLTFHDAEKADASKHGQIGYCYCGDCHKYFKMGTNGPDFTKELEQDEWLIHFYPDDKDYDLEDAANTKELKEEATCKSGNVYYKKCKHCNVYSDNLTIEDSVRTAHTPAEEWTVPSGADCEKADFTKRLLCTVCGQDAVPAVEIKKGSHEEENKDVVPATCLKEGHQAGVYCNKCCKYLLGGETIQKTSHDVKVIIKGTPATCTEKGTQDVLRCIICKSNDTLIGATVKKVNGEETIVPNEIPKLGHTLADVKKRDRTCEEDGYNMDARICSRCGLSFSPMGADVVDKARGHNPEKVEERAATTSEKGCHEHYVCNIEINGKKCGQLFLQELDSDGKPKVDPTTHKPVLRKATEAEVIIPVKDHQHKYTKVEAKSYAKTCTKDGKLVEKCDICGDEKETVLTATGHNWQWVDVEQATCSKEGSRYEECSVCHAKRGQPETTGKAEHDWELTTPADCTKGGTATYTCKNCKATKQETVTKRDKHTDADDNGVCEVCGTKFCSCLCHNKTWYGKILYFFVQVWWQFLGMRATCACGKVHYVKAAAQDVPTVT